MNDPLDFDLDEQALTKKRRPWGWFAAGAVLIAAGSLLAGAYLPLHQAHEKLVAEHEKLAQKARELDHALQQSQEKFADTDAKRTRLRKAVDTLRGDEKSLNSRYEIAAATARDQLKSFIKGKHLSVDIQRNDLLFEFTDRILYRRGSTALSPRISGTLCKATESLGSQKDWTATVVAGAPSDEKDYWETASDKAANVASTLEKRCKIPAPRIFATARGPGDGDGKLNTELRIGPREKPTLKLETTAEPEDAKGQAKAATDQAAP